MLVLSRKRDEVIVIETSDGPIEIMVCSQHDMPVRIGIRAPRNCGVWRKEIYERRQLEGKIRP
jgi:carbon storage regulator CsrA